MKKRILSIMLLCCMVLTLLPTAVFAAETGAMDTIPTKFDVEIDLCNRTSDINIKDSKTYYIYSSSSDPDFVWTKKIQINGKKAAHRPSSCTERRRRICTLSTGTVS